MKNRFFIAFLLISICLVGCGSKKSQLQDAIEDILKIEGGLLYFYQHGGVDSLTDFLVESKAMQIALIEELALSKELKIDVQVDTIRIQNNMEDAVLENLYRAKAAEEYLLGISYVELQNALQRYKMDNEKYSVRGIETVQSNIALLVGLLEGYEQTNKNSFKRRR